METRRLFIGSSISARSDYRCLSVVAWVLRQVIRPLAQACRAGTTRSELLSLAVLGVKETSYISFLRRSAPSLRSTGGEMVASGSLGMLDLHCFGLSLGWWLCVCGVMD